MAPGRIGPEVLDDCGSNGPLRRRSEEERWTEMEEQGRFRLEGMACAACAARVERILGKTPGVISGNVNFSMGTLEVRWDPESVGLDDIRQRLGKAGFTLGTRRPDVKALSAGVQTSLAELRRKTAFSAILLAPLLVLSMGPMAGLEIPRSFAIGAIQCALALGVMAIHRRTYLDGIGGLARLSPDMSSMVALGTLASFSYSAVALALYAVGGPGTENAFPDLYFDSTATILTLVSLGKSMECASRGRTTRALESLAALLPSDACVVREDGTEERVPVQGLAMGDVAMARPGERVPADGVALADGASLDESSMTGESVPVDKVAGGRVYGGTMVVDGLLRFRIDKVGGDTALAGIIRTVEDAQGCKAPVARLADRLAGAFVPAVLAMSLLAFFLWMALDRGVGFSLEAMVSVLVVACPCALGLATPTAVLVGTGRAALEGILFKGGDALEALAGVDTVAFDKTGTLTLGRPVLKELVPEDGVSPEELLAMAAGAEAGSRHPFALALADAAKDRGVTPVPCASFQSIPGRGVAATAEAHGVIGEDLHDGGRAGGACLGDSANGPSDTSAAQDGAAPDGLGSVGGKRILVGNAAFLRQEGVPESALAPWVEAAVKLAEEGKTPLFVASDGVPRGICAVADAVAPGAAEAVRRLKEMGLKTVMVTGDNSRVASAIADEVGIAEVISDVMPEEKAAVVSRLKGMGRKVAMVGDGVNDAPALATSDAGIALAKGLDVAVESASVVLARGDLTAVPSAVRLGRMTLRTIRRGLFFAFVYNALAIPLAMGLLTLAGGPALSPMVAAACMSLSSVSVVLNALSLNWRKA